jgi:hypothetical protein
MRWALVFPAVLAVASCDDANVHILTGQLYDPVRMCVGPSSGVDVINGASTGDNCSPSCLTIASPTTSGTTTAVYITTVCPPFPVDYSVEAEDAATEAGDPCPGAFAAYIDDAGCPPTPDDGGDDGGGTGGDAAGDAATDAGADAAGDAPGGG